MRSMAWLLSSAVVCGGGVVHGQRIGNCSPAFRVAPDALGYYANQTVWVGGDTPGEEGHRELSVQIEPKILAMIDGAETTLILSFFLFDSFYGESSGARDIVGEMVAHVIERKRVRPDLAVALILDPCNRAYSDRVSPAEAALRAHGVDVFYSDLISGLKRGAFLGVREGLGHVGRALDVVTFKVLGKVVSRVGAVIPVPVGRFDGRMYNLEMAYNAALMKANHRKLVVADSADGTWEMLVSSANPHNASGYHVNNAVSVRGAPALYGYQTLREDMRRSVKLGSRYVHWHDGKSRAYRRNYFKVAFPERAVDGERAGGADAGGAQVTVLTERAIESAALELMASVSGADVVDIQMFYLSRKPVVEAIIEASTRVDRPIRLLLDANKDSFNRQKDGTPNRQVARHMLREAALRGGKLEVRWYATHGEQNHVKSASVRNVVTGRMVLLMGSCNWTGRNMAGVNMEANLLVEGCPQVVNGFCGNFDVAWRNGGDGLQSLPYEAFAPETASNRKWHLGEKPFFYSTF